MKRYLAAVLFLLAAGCTKSPQEKIDQLYRQGLAGLDGFQFDLARSAFDEIKKIDSASPLVPFGYALAYEREWKLFDAINGYMNVTSVHRDYSQAWAGLARIYVMLDLPGEAVRAAKKYAESTPGDFKARRALVEALILDRQFDRALLELGKESVSPDREAIVDLLKARIFQAQNRPDSAAVVQKSAMAKPLNSPEFYAAAASYMEQTGLLDSAMVLSRKSREVAGSDYEAEMTHFFRALRTKYVFDARQVIDGMVKRGAGDFVRVSMYRFYYQLGAGNVTKARWAGDEMRSLAPDNVSVMILANQTGGRVADGRAVQADFTAILSTFEGGGYNKELQALVKYYLGVILARSKDAPVAIKKLEELGTEYTRRRDVTIALTTLYYKGGLFDKFNQTVTELAEMYKDSAAWISGLGDAYAALDITVEAEAVKFYRQALTVDQWHRPAFENLVRLFDGRRRFADELKVFDDYPHFTERYPELAVARAICLVRNGRIPEGVALFKEKIGYLKGRTSAFSGMVILLDLKGSPKEKADIVRLLVDLNPDNNDALVLAACYEADDGNYVRALELADRVVSRDADNLDAQVQKARALFWAGKKDQAFAGFEAVLQKDFNHADANFYFSNLMGRTKTDLSRAENLARRAFFESDRTVKYALNISFVYFQAGRYDLSRGEALKVAGTNPDNPEVFFRYGMALYMEGKKEAKEFLRKAVTLGLSGEDLTAAQETLSKL